MMSEPFLGDRKKLVFTETEKSIDKQVTYIV